MAYSSNYFRKGALSGKGVGLVLAIIFESGAYFGNYPVHVYQPLAHAEQKGSHCGDCFPAKVKIYQISMVFSNYSLLKLLCLGLCFAYASATPTSQTQNSTVDLPVGTSNHGDSKLICIPAKWSDIITFYLGNYVAHVITIISYPGASTMETIIAVISAFLLPGAGIFRALRAIFSKSRFAEDDLRAAARAGALCTLIDESKLPGDKSPGWWKLVITGND